MNSFPVNPQPNLSTTGHDGAVLLVSFRRPDLTRRVLDVLRRVRPARLYLATDAARPDRPAEVAANAEVRRALDEGVDWPCSVFRDDAPANLGARRRMISAIDWLFASEASGIILEDDCLPEETFFPFCQELLARYADEPRVMMISGEHGGQAGDPALAESYFFSRYPRIWGWATWRRAWALYDEHLPGWELFKRNGGLRAACPHPGEAAEVTHLVELTLAGGLDAWDYQWHVACWQHGGLAAVPKWSQVRNLGFRADATHTTAETHGHLVQESRPLAFPLVHPAEVRADAARDRRFWRTVLRPPGLLRRVRRRLRRVWAAIHPPAPAPANLEPAGVRA